MHTLFLKINEIKMIKPDIEEYKEFINQYLCKSHV